MIFKSLPASITSLSTFVDNKLIKAVAFLTPLIKVSLSTNPLPSYISTSKCSCKSFKPTSGIAPAT